MEGSFSKVLVLAAVAAGSLNYQQAWGRKYLIELRSPTQFNQMSRDLKFLKAQGPMAFSRDMLGQKETLGVKLFNTNARLTQTLDHLGMAFVEVKSEADLELLKASTDIVSIEEDQTIPLPRQPLLNSKKGARLLADDNHSLSEGSLWGINAVDAAGAWEQNALGQNVKVVVLDTGIDKDHPDLKNRFLDGKDFVSSKFGEPGDEDEDGGNDWAARLPSFEKFFAIARGEKKLNFPKKPIIQIDDIDDLMNPPPYPYFDQNGHGTHVAGTIAAERDGNGVVGVAPQARILAGRVCGRFGCSNFAILNGINWAIEQKAHVISMSLGGPSDVRSQREALQRAEDANIVAVAASGNDGTNQVSFPGGYPTVISVGAVDSTLKRAVFSQFGPELDVMAPGVDVRSSVPVGSGRASKVSVTLNGVNVETKSTSFSGSPEITTPLSSALVLAGLGKPEDFSADVRGKFALVQRGEIPFADKVKNAVTAGAKGIVIYNNVEGLISGAVTTDGSTVAIPVVMIERVIGENLKANITGGIVETATLQTLRTDYAEFQGTSMATPHVSGVVALMLSKNPALKPAQLRQALYSTASPAAATPENEYGAGLVNASKAVTAAGQGGF